MKFKRRSVTVYRDFPEGCGPLRRTSNGDHQFLKQSEFKAHGDIPDIKEAASDHSETKTSRIDGLNNLRDVSSTEDVSVLEFNGGVKCHQEEEGIGESEGKQKKTCCVKKRCSCSHNSTTEVGRDVMGTSKRIIVLGISAKSKSPWTHPKRRRPRQAKTR